MVYHDELDFMTQQNAQDEKLGRIYDQLMDGKRHDPQRWNPSHAREDLCYKDTTMEIAHGVMNHHMQDIVALMRRSKQ